MELGLRGKRALVLGSSDGLGYAIAEELVKEGVEVCLCARSQDRLETAARFVGARAYVVADLLKPGAGKVAVEQAATKLGGSIEILVTNTGGPPKGSFVSLTNEQWQEGFQSLWLSAVDSIRAALPAMQEKRWGRILLVTSAAAREPMPGLAVSNGLRAGLLGLTKTISNEIAGDGVTINALLPGYTRTERMKQLGVDEAKISAQIPAARLGEPQEFAAVAAFLASERASYVTGQMIAVDGGYLHGI